MPRTSIPSIEEAPHFSTNLNKYTTPNRVYQWHIRCFQDSLYDLLQMAGARTMLDAGCGEGFLANYLHGRDPSLQITGLDANPDAVAFANEYFGDAARFQTGSIFELPFEDDAFDLVLCSEVLEHLEDPDAAMAELKRVSRRFVLITVPLEPIFNMLNVLGQRLGVNPDPEHIQFWTRKSFQKWIGGHLHRPRFAYRHYYQMALGEL